MKYSRGRAQSDGNGTEPPSISPPMVSTQSAVVKMETHQKIQSQFVEPFARKMDAKIKQKEATSPVGRLGAFTFGTDAAVDGLRRAQIQKSMPSLVTQPQSVDFLAQRVKLSASHSAQPHAISLGPAMNDKDAPKRKLRSWTSAQSQAAPLKRHSVGSPVDLASKSGMTTFNGQLLSHHNALNVTLQNLKQIAESKKEHGPSSSAIVPSEDQPERLLFTRNGQRQNVDAPPTIDEGSEPETEPETEPLPEPQSITDLKVETAAGSPSQNEADLEFQSEAKRVLFAQIPADNDSEDDRSDLDVEEMAAIRRQRRQNGSMRVRISSPGSVLEEVMADKANRRRIVDALEVARCSDDSLAPTDDEPIPDGSDDVERADSIEVILLFITFNHSVTAHI